MTDPIKGDTMTTTPKQPFSGLVPLHMTVITEKKLVFEKVAMRALLIEIRRSLKWILATVDMMLEVCA